MPASALAPPPPRLPQLQMPRLAQLLDMSVDEAEKHVADLVVAKAISAKVDRPAGIVRFGKRQAAEDTLNTWASNIGKLLDLVEKSCQQISKEAMLHKVSITAAGVAPAAGGGGAQTAAAAQ